MEQSEPYFQNVGPDFYGEKVCMVWFLYVQ